MIKSLILSFILSTAAFAQTSVAVQQVTSPAPLTNMVWVSIPGQKGFVPAILGNNLTLVNNAGVYTISAVVPTTSVVFKTDYTKVGVTVTQSFTTSVAVNGGKTNLEVFRNGILQQEAEDYIATVNADNTVTVNFTNNVVTSGDSIKFRYVI